MKFKVASSVVYLTHDTILDINNCICDARQGFAANCASSFSATQGAPQGGELALHPTL